MTIIDIMFFVGLFIFLAIIPNLFLSSKDLRVEEDLRNRRMKNIY